jgi:hypothetical protein
MTAKLLLVALLLANATVGCAAEGPTAQITFKVTGENGASLSNVPIHVVLFDHQEPGAGFGNPIYKEITSLTDTQGIAVARGSSLDNKVTYEVKDLSGYYDEGGPYSFKSSKDGRWEPWNPTVELVLRPIVNPVPMYARKVETNIPTPAHKYGYDLVLGDWVAPTGKGQITDFIFEVTGYANNVKDYDSTLTVSFANAQDGIQSFVPIRVCHFRSPRAAPVGGYQDKIALRRARRPGQLSPDWIDDAQKETNYIFRVRTVLDEKGNVKSALYGKIYGGFGFGGAVTNCFLKIRSYYLNPEPNSRNMEFDPKRNLFRKLDQFHEVSLP